MIKLKTQIVMKLKNSNGDKTQKLKLWQNSKTQIVTKLKNSNCDNLKTQIVTTEILTKQNYDKTQVVTKLKNSKCDKIQIVTKLKNSKCDKNKKFKLWQN